MFENTSNIVINGGTFAQHQHQHGPSLLNINNASKTAIDRLMEAASLGALHNSGERFDPPKCHSNTRTVVLQKLMEWFIGQLGWNMLALWLYGPAGAGKSAIAQTFAELCAAENGLLASFFFSRSDPRRNNAKVLVATLAYQVSLNIPESRAIIEGAIDKNPAIFQLNFQTQFQTLILDPLLQLSRAGRFTSATPFPSLIIIDGLDECDGVDVQNTILNTISSALQHHRLALPFRILIASRPEYHLTTSFSVAPLYNLTFHLALDDTYQPDEDIRLYLTDSFHDIQNTHIMHAHLPDSWPSEGDIAELVIKSSGQFIYAATVIRYVSSPKCNPLNCLKVIQGLLPVNDNRPYAQLDALYINILSNVKDVKAVLRILGMALVLTKVWIEPQTVNNLEEFMQLTPGTVQLLLIDLLSVVDASHNYMPIKFLHASFTDFLIDPTRSRQFFIDPSKMHEEAAHFCISAIELLDMATPLPNLAYRSLLSHLRLTGPLHDNTTLREKVLHVPYVQHWTTYALSLSDDLSSDPAMFVHFLKTSQFKQTEELYLHHRSILDHELRRCLAFIPRSPRVDFWTAVCASGILKYHRTVTFLTISILSSPPANIPAYVPGIFFDASFYHIEVVGWRRRPLLDGFSARTTSTPWLRMVAEFLNDPSRAEAHAVDQLMYTTAAVFAVEFAVRAWDETKAIYPHPFQGNQWDFIWDAFVFILSKARYSAELVNLLGKQNLTFSLGRPGANVRHRVQILFAAVRNYLLKFKGSSPSPFKIIINWSGYPNDSSDHVNYCYTAYDLDDNNNTIRGIFYVDGSIFSSDEDVQELGEAKRSTMREYIVRVWAYIRKVMQ
ncbi:hypothetical protein CVT25_008838 [Psilocybe cyanescens]|uniref:Nephrocystin 3-like N-terminal domain-containing protein n=1 Tax=Psilocybe cyanescens TaxID=93625 RepID=A0A409XAQ0_PSICY|nr:hypothetical protein CVT25_008838 [Psilocybe cyanescens]